MDGGSCLTLGRQQSACFSQPGSVQAPYLRKQAAIAWLGKSVFYRNQGYQATAARMLRGTAAHQGSSNGVNHISCRLVRASTVASELSRSRWRSDPQCPSA